MKMTIVNLKELNCNCFLFQCRSEDRLFHTESSITYVFCKAPPLQKHGVIGDISKEIVTIDGHQYLVPCHIAHAMQM